MSIYHEYMTNSHEPRGKRVSEPLQVYLDRGQRRRLEQLAAELGLSKSDVVRRGLEALERQITAPGEHPALNIIGIASRETTKAVKYDIAVEHDRYLAETEQKSWKPPPSRKRGS